jgi:hypothetical protein
MKYPVSSCKCVLASWPSRDRSLQLRKSYKKAAAFSSSWDIVAVACSNNDLVQYQGRRREKKPSNKKKPFNRFFFVYHDS